LGTVWALAHPVQTVLESLYAAERCPRLHVNAMKDGVVCPDFIREQWKERLVIDLDASYPLALEMDEDGLSADLSFGGYVSRCSFPWAAIYVVSDRDSGRGIVLEQNVPMSVRAQMEAAKRPKPRLSAVDDLPDAADAAEDGAPAGDAPRATDEAPPRRAHPDGAAVVLAAVDDAAEDEEDSDDGEASDDAGDTAPEGDAPTAPAPVRESVGRAETREPSAPVSAAARRTSRDSTREFSPAAREVGAARPHPAAPAGPKATTPSDAASQAASAKPVSPAAAADDDLGHRTSGPASADDQARAVQRRRAAFRVIDGGS
jgi:stringent starvation protein B